jgi:hypothetical protein
VTNVTHVPRLPPTQGDGRAIPYKDCTFLPGFDARGVHQLGATGTDTAGPSYVG